MSQIKPSRGSGTPPTLEEWEEWAKTATRNLTDEPIGRHSVGKRLTDARNSEVVTPQPLNPATRLRGTEPPTEPPEVNAEGPTWLRAARNAQRGINTAPKGQEAL